MATHSGLFPDRRQRRKGVWQTPNCAMADQTTTLVVCCQPKPPLDTTARAATLTYNVRLPYIVNTRHIEADEKVILEWALPKNKKKSEIREETWADDVAGKKREKEEAPAAGS